jgi:solute carrier family 25 folate transporter 32
MDQSVTVPFSWDTMDTSSKKAETSTRPGASFAPLIAGFSGGVTSTSLLLPLDVIKVRLQVSENGDNVRRAGGVKRRLGAMRIFRGIIKHEGLAGLYQGWTPAVIGSAVSWGGYFYLYENFKQQLVTYKLQSSATPVSPEALRENSTHLNSADNFFLACASGACMVALTNPIWLIKTRMQLQMRKSSQLHTEVKAPYKNMLDAAVTIVREEGVFALYKGGGAAMLLTSHGGVQFVVYEFLKKHFNYKRASREENLNRSVWERFELSMGYLSIGAVAKM